MTYLLDQKNNVSAVLFLVGIIFISYGMWLWTGTVLLLLLIVSKNTNFRFLASIFICFLVSLVIYQLMNMVIGQYDFQSETRIILNRSLLLIMVTGLYTAHRLSKKEFFFYHHRPQWSQVIQLPFHSIKLSNLLVVVVVSSGAAFLPFVLQKDLLTNNSFIVFCILFSLINATLEEWIWRGILLSSLVKYVGVSYALVVTSIGFGLMHLIIGIPFILCLFFSLGGLFYGVIVLKTNSLFPSIIFHIVINIGMVFSGFIL
ncbi:CPBP family intramembrane glutamic endopeptidase [Robertmurraya sp. GLU-23]